ncbi:MAG: hypothetical protein AB7K24_00425 [Gemmataceae bacterium]
MKRLAILLLLLGTAAALADEAAPAGKKLVVQAREAPVPALRYRLLPGIEEQQAGNAALDYYRAFAPESFWHRREEKIDEKLDAWQKVPLAELPVKEMGWLRTYAPLRQCDHGARRQHCDWDLTARLRADGVMTPLADVQPIRELVRLLALRARLELAEGKVDRALYSIQTALALSRQVGEGPTLINGLVGVACMQRPLDVVEELIQQPDAPNLYWALSALPRPFIDMRVCCEGERLLIHGPLPDMEKLASRPLSNVEAAELLQELSKIAEAVEGKPANVAAVLAAVGLLQTEAKQALLKQGFTKPQLEAMPAVQIVVLYGIREYRRCLDERIKWVGMPYEQAVTGLREADRALEKDNAQMGKFIRQLMPALESVLNAQMRVERRLAALRVVEAIRLHAAQHGGKPPARLDAITVVPVPNDPLFDKPFEYRVHDDHVELFALLPPGVKEDPRLLRYRIEIKKK